MKKGSTVASKRNSLGPSNGSGWYCMLGKAGFKRGLRTGNQAWVLLADIQGGVERTNRVP